MTYVDTSVLLKLLVADEDGAESAQRLWLAATDLLCAEIGHAEARAALASVRRRSRLDAAGLRTAKVELEALWEQIDVVVVDADLVRTAGDVAEEEGLRGYDAVHLAATAAGATIVASADDQLVAAAHRRGFNVANPLDRPTGRPGDDD